MRVIMEDATDTAKKIRKALKKNFPEYKASHFKVKTSKYTGGSSINVKWKDNPSSEEVNKVIKQYESAHFDGMQDLETVNGYKDPEDGKMYSGAKYIFADFSVSKERDQAVRDYIYKEYGHSEFDGKMDYMQWQRLYNETINVFDENNKLKDEFSEEYFEQEKEKIDLKESIDKALEQEIEKQVKNDDFNSLITQVVIKNVLLVKNENLRHQDELKESYKREIKNRIYRDYGGFTDKAEEILKNTSIKDEFEKTLQGVIGGHVYSSKDEYKKEAMEIIGDRFNKELREEYNKLVGTFGKTSTVEEFKKDLMSVDYKDNFMELVDKVDMRKHDLDDAIIRAVESHGGAYWHLAQKEENEREESNKKEEEDKPVDINEYKKVKFTKQDVKKVAEVIKDESKKQGVSSKELMKKIDQKYLKETKEKDPENFLDNVRKKLREGVEDEVDDLESALEEQLGTEEVKEEEKTFDSLRDLSETVLKHLLAGEVNIVFTKANGDERHMRATRNTGLFKEHDDLVQGFTESNQKSNIGQEINTGTIGVVDLDIDGGGARKFVTERLKSYQPKGETKINVKVGAKDKKEENNHYNPVQKLNTEKMIDILGKKVVRLVFEKKDGSKRAMIATRNPNIVELYVGLDNNGKRPINRIKEDRESDIKSQIEKDYVKVLDVEKQAFRTFKPSKLVEYDEDLDIASWIEFSEKNDAWYDIAFNGKDPRDFYQEGKKTGVNIGNELSERISYEREQRDRLRDEQAARETLEKSSQHAQRSREEQKEKVARLKEVHKTVLEEVKNVPDQVKTDNFYKMYEEFLSVPDKLKKDKSFNNMELEITKVQKSDDRCLVVISMRNDYIYLHPLFIVNGYSGRVYADETKIKAFDDIGDVYKSDADWGSEDILEPLANKVKMLGKGNKERKETDKDEVRLKRLLALGKDNEEEFKKQGVQFFEQKVKNSELKLLGIKMNGKVYLVHPNYMLEVREGKTYVIHKNEENSSVSGYTNFLSGWIGSADSEAERNAMKNLTNMILQGIDLRKRVS